MRDFTQEDYTELQKKLDILNNIPIKYEDNTFNEFHVRNIVRPIVRLAVPDDAECLDYAKKIWNFLLLDFYPVKYSRFLKKEDKGTNNLNYDLIQIDKIDSNGVNSPDEIVIIINTTV